MKRLTFLIQEYSLPLLLGLVASLLWANIDYESYHHVVETPIFGDFKIFNHPVTLHFLINDIFMVFFFGIAAVEIVHAFLPGGPLTPLSKSINPIFGTLGGILGPILIFFILVSVIPIDLINSDAVEKSDMLKGWGIPTATDIAMAWMVMKLLFGSRHPAVSYLLLLAVADDAIGLFIIAIFYPDPVKSFEPQYLLIIVLAIILALLFRKFKIRSFYPYIFICGALSWVGLILSTLHPALALVFIVGLMPNKGEKNTLLDFEHKFKLPVDIGLFGFAFANAGVELSSINILTFIILASLILGKTLGIGSSAILADKLGYKLPSGMNYGSLIVLSIVAGLGLTVSLFITSVAYTNMDLLNGAKMGALFSIFVAPIAWLVLKIFKIK